MKIKKITFVTLLSFYCLISFSQKNDNDKYILGNYEYISLESKPSGSSINITTIKNEKSTPEQQRKMDSLDFLKNNDPRYSKIYFNFTRNQTTEYRFGSGLRTKSKNKKNLLYKSNYPIYKVTEKKGDSIFVFDKQFRTKAVFVKTNDNLSDFPIYDMDQ